MIDGITIEQNGSATICRINNFSDALKSEIRDRLSVICHGPDPVAEGSVYSTYKNTLREFNTRYSEKHENLKKGMIGELLTHILLLKSHTNLEPVSPYFNLEERAIKKGFDVVVFDKDTSQLWITEVKAGNAGANVASPFNQSLLNRAKNDLVERLGGNQTNLWLNAINGAKIAVSRGKVKDRINEILEDCYQEASDEDQSPDSKNVILVSVTYKDLQDPVTVESVSEKHTQISAEQIFAEVIIFSIQKETYQRVAEFLQSEAQL